MKRELIARVAHEVNRAYCASLGDDSQPAWADAEQWQKDSALAGVDMHLANPDATPEQSHAAWLAAKQRDGWTYGEVKDVEKKQHPCCVPYDELPAEQKAKDYLFRGVVHALAALPMDALSAAPVATNGVPVIAGHVPVRYCGRRDVWTDHIYGSGLSFTKGQTRSLPAELARKLLRHTDVFVAGEVEAETAAEVEAPEDDTADLLEEAEAKRAEQEKERSALQDLRDQVMLMDKTSLERFAKTNYRQDLDKRKAVTALREQVIGMIDQFGAV